MNGQSRTVGSDGASLSSALSARMTARRDDRRRRFLRVWSLRLLAGAGGIWLLLVAVGSLASSA